MAITLPERMALVGEHGRVRLIERPSADEPLTVDGVGVVPLELIEQAGLGGELVLGSTRLRVLPLTPELVFRGLARRAQVIGPQDAARIVHATGLGPGATVVECGAGSGALTAYLAFVVGDAGHVHTHDVREDHLDTARANMRRAGLEPRVTFHHEDLAKADTPCDAFIADVPEPADVAGAAERCLAPGGRAAFYTPLVSQLEAVRNALDGRAFADVETLEQMERRWVVHERGSRPDFDMLGHTGFLTFATRVR